QHRHVDQVVAHVARGGGLEAQPLQYPAELLALAGDALSHQLDAELAGPLRYRRRLAPRKNRAADAAVGEHLHAVAVEGMEGLDLAAVGAVPEAAVGEHAVDVEDHQLDSPRPVERVGSGELHAS